MTTRESLAAHYATVYRDRDYGMGWARRRPLESWLREHGTKRGSYLDVGCGRGESLVIALNCDIEETVGLEVVPVPSGGFTLAGLEQPPAGWPWSSVLRMDGIHRLPAFDQSFDLVTCLDVLEHVPEADALLGLRELIRVTRRRLLISVAWFSHVHRGVELHINRHDAEWWMHHLQLAAEEMGAQPPRRWQPPVEQPADTAWFEVVR